MVIWTLLRRQLCSGILWRVTVLEKIRFTVKFNRTYREFPYTSCLLWVNTHTVSPIITYCNRMVYLLQLKNLHWHFIMTQSLWFYISVHFGAVYSVSFDWCIVTCIHLYNVQKSYTALKIFCDNLFISPLHPRLLETKDYFSVSIILFF